MQLITPPPFLLTARHSIAPHFPELSRLLLAMLPRQRSPHSKVGRRLHKGTVECEENIAMEVQGQQVKARPKQQRLTKDKALRLRHKEQEPEQRKTKNEEITQERSGDICNESCTVTEKNMERLKTTMRWQ